MAGGKYNNQLIINCTSLSKVSEILGFQGLVNNGIRDGLGENYFQLDILSLREEPNKVSLQNQLNNGQSAYYIDQSAENTIILYSKDLFNGRISMHYFSSFDELLSFRRNQLYDMINSLDNNSRIYIIVHHSRLNKKTGQDLIKEISPMEFAKLMAINPKFKIPTNKPLTISFVMCECVNPELVSESIGYKQAQELAQIEVYARVLGRISNVGVNYEEDRTVKKNVYKTHHLEHTKMSFECDPQTKRILYRYAIYTDNTASLILALNYADRLYYRIKNDEMEILEGSFVQNLCNRSSLNRRKLACLAWDIALEENMYESDPETFDKLDQMRWGYNENSMDIDEVYSIINKSLLRNIGNNLKHGASIVKTREDTLRLITPNSRYDTERKLSFFNETIRRNIMELSEDNGTITDNRIIDKVHHDHSSFGRTRTSINWVGYSQDIKESHENLEEYHENLEEYHYLLASVYARHGGIEKKRGNWMHFSLFS